MAGGGRERLARDPGQPIWMLLTWPRGPDALPTPQLSREGRGWGLRPLPQSNLSFRGGDTPDYILPPHQDKGNIGAPLEGSRIQILHCGGLLTAENNKPRASCDHTPAGPG